MFVDAQSALIRQYVTVAVVSIVYAKGLSKILQDQPDCTSVSCF